jgi:hypothetical protein
MIHIAQQAFDRWSTKRTTSENGLSTLRQGFRQMSVVAPNDPCLPEMFDGDRLVPIENQPSMGYGSAVGHDELNTEGSTNFAGYVVPAETMLLRPPADPGILPVKIFGHRS